MFLIRRGINLIKIKPASIVTFSTSVNTNDFKFKPKFSIEDEKKILNILNESTAEQLSRFDVSQGRIKSLESWRMKKGPFETLSDILEVDGLGIKVLERLCESIINNNNNINNEQINNSSSKPANNIKVRRQVLTPNFPSELVDNLSSAVGLHLDPTGISWAKLTCGNKILDWNFYSFSSLPKKLLPHETYDLAVKIVNKIPVGDVYILESPSNLSPTNQKQSIAVSYMHQLELGSMLFALINSSPTHNRTVNGLETDANTQNKVFYLRSKLPARLFKTLVGTERVSTTNVISDLIKNQDNSLPCSKIIVDEQLKHDYYMYPAGHQDLVGQALLLIVTFMDICIYKNSISINALNPRNK